jgi:hypothetical protein
MMDRPRAVPAGLCLAVVALALGATWPRDPEGEGKRGRDVQPSVTASSPEQPAAVPSPGRTGFAPQTRLGFHVGDQWEPALATDHQGGVYVLYPQYEGVPGCDTCASPTAVLQISRDHGSTWDSPRPIAPTGTAQVDTQIAVDPADGRTLYAAWLQNDKSDIAVAKSTDLGETWTVTIADETNAGTDKPILAVRGGHVYVGYNHSMRIWVSSSHDGGETWTSAIVNPNGNLGWALAGGGTVTPDGAVFFSWAGYERNGGAKGNVNLFVSRSADGGATWTSRVLDVSAAPPDCSAYQCGWAYLGAQATLASDAAGTLYALWNGGPVARGPERVYFARSADGGLTWSTRRDVSAAAAGVHHAFPAIAAAAPGDVRISWMDARQAPLWNVYYRSSSDGGARFSGEKDLSTYVEGFSYIQPAGFSYPFGDYYEMQIDERGDSHLIFGEGLNWLAPGSIWYTRGR